MPILYFDKEKSGQERSSTQSSLISCLNNLKPSPPGYCGIQRTDELDTKWTHSRPLQTRDCLNEKSAKDCIQLLQQINLFLVFDSMLLS